MPVSAKRDSSAALESAPKREQPTWAAPMLAVLTHERFSDPGWLFERKLDGVRCLAFRRGSDLRLRSRTRQTLNGTFPELLDPLLGQPCSEFIVDGEVIAFEGTQTSFARLQRRLGIHDPVRARATGVRIFYYVFDVLYLDGHDTTGLPLRTRKALLRNELTFARELRFVPHLRGEGERLYREACRKGWEGLIAKRADAPYQHKRSRDWLKFKCVNEQEFVIGGFTDPTGARFGFGALLIGYYDARGTLRYAGKVGTGYSEALLRELSARLHRLERDAPPFTASDLPRRGVHWVKPELVAQVAFSELTREGKLRHPRFLGLREDKPAREVVLETAA
jgi:bifunctional non-homologous end joining protein LigD